MGKLYFWGMALAAAWFFVPFVRQHLSMNTLTVVVVVGLMVMIAHSPLRKRSS